MEPTFKHIFEFENFFRFLKIDIYQIEIIAESDKTFFKEAPDIFIQTYKAPGIHIYINGLAASLNDFLLNSTFKKYFNSIQEEILLELSQNLENSRSSKKLNEYLSKLKTTLIECEGKIIEEHIKNENEIQCKYSYINSSIRVIGLSVPEGVELQVEEFVKEIAYEYLYVVLHWIKDQIRSLNSKVTKMIASAKPSLISLKSIKSFEFTKQKYYPSRLSLVFNDLRDGEFIDSSTSPEQLNKIFENTHITNPVRWKAKESDLYYFIKQLIVNKIVLDPKKDIWEKTIICFVKLDGALLKKDKLRGSKRNKRSSEIETIVRKFLLI